MAPKERRKRPAGNQGALEKCKNSAAANTGKRTKTQAPRLTVDPRFRARVERFWGLGPAIAALLLARLAEQHDCRGEVERLLDAAVEHRDAIQQFGLGRPGAAP